MRQLAIAIALSTSAVLSVCTIPTATFAAHTASYAQDSIDTPIYNSPPGSIYHGTVCDRSGNYCNAQWSMKAGSSVSFQKDWIVNHTCAIANIVLSGSQIVDNFGIIVAQGGKAGQTSPYTFTLSSLPRTYVIPAGPIACGVARQSGVIITTY